MNVPPISSYQNCNTPLKADSCYENKKFTPPSAPNQQTPPKQADFADCFVKTENKEADFNNQFNYPDLSCSYCSGGGTN